MSNKNMNLPPKLFNKNFVLLWQGQAVSKLGTQFFTIAMVFWLKHTTDSASLVGMMLMTAALPEVIFATLGGVFADRYKRRKIIIACDALNGFFMLLLGIIFFVFPDTPEYIVISIFVAVLVMSVLNSFFTPAISAALPDLVPKQNLTTANSMVQLSEQISVFIGQGLGGVLFRIIGAPLLVIINGITFLVSAFSELFIKIPQQIPHKGNSRKEEIGKVKKDILSGYKYVWKNSGLKRLVLLSSLMNFLTMPIIVLLPFFVEDFLLLTSDWYGFLLAIYSAGTLAGYMLAGLLKIKGRVRSSMLLIFMTIEAAGYAGLGMIRNPEVALIAAFFIGSLGGMVTVNILTIMQLSTPSRIRGRVFGFLTTLAGAMSPLGMGIAGFIYDYTGKNLPLIYFSCGIIMFTLIVTLSVNGELRKFLAYDYKEEKHQVSIPEKAVV